MPESFPLHHAENSGNMIHGNAPFEMFDDAIHSSNRAAILTRGHKSFTDFANAEASHVILTLANSLRSNDDDGTRYARLAAQISEIKVPVVVFGLGIQAESDDINTITLHPEARELMKRLADKAELLGVRGKLSARVLEKECGVTNTRTTGCPSLLSRPHALVALRDTIQAGTHLKGRPSFNGTKLHQDSEKQALHRALQADHFIVEPVNKFNHAYFLATSRGERTDPPYFLREYIGSAGGEAGSRESQDELAQRFRSNYRLFRSPESWYQFNSEAVSYGYGTRFHGNMATILSGRPALWITHDARTRELVEFARLPHVSQEEFDEMGWEGVPEKLNYEPFFDRITALYNNFNSYLSMNGIKPVRTFASAARRGKGPKSEESEAPMDPSLRR